MKSRTKRGLIIVGGLATLAVVSTLVLNAFQDNLVFFFSPSQVATKEAPADRSFRLGGLVEEGSVKRSSDSLAVQFVVTDGAKAIPVTYNGLLPDMFREGKGVVAQGRGDGRPALGAQEGQERIAQRGQHFGGMTDMDLALVFPQGHIVWR